jgi:hypothetical protein
MGDKVTAETFATLGLSVGHLSEMHKAFREIDEDGSGSIDITEFLDYVDVKLTPFSKRVFSLMDEDGSGQVSVRKRGGSRSRSSAGSSTSNTFFALRLLELHPDPLPALPPPRWTSGSS